jgi:hypothetical protein
MVLQREEYIEQAHFFGALREGLQRGLSTQEVLAGVRNELLATTKLPLALDFMGSEMRLTGGFHTAMARMDHYFTPFQAYVVGEAEKPEGRLDFQTALAVLEHEAECRAKSLSVQGMFLYQFEALCRNRLGYDRGLEAIAADPIYDRQWRDWIDLVRRQVGIVDLADMIYVRSEYFRTLRGDAIQPILFGEKEGRIALANRKKDPLFLFSALARQLGYPPVPRPRRADDQGPQLIVLQRRLDRLEQRLRLAEEELRGGINLNRFLASESPPPPDSASDFPK